MQRNFESFPKCCHYSNSESSPKQCKQPLATTASFICYIVFLKHPIPLNLCLCLNWPSKVLHLSIISSEIFSKHPKSTLTVLKQTIYINIASLITNIFSYKWPACPPCSSPPPASCWPSSPSRRTASPYVRTSLAYSLPQFEKESLALPHQSLENQSGGEMFGPMVWSSDTGVGKRVKMIKRRSEMNARGFHGDSMTGRDRGCCVRHHCGHFHKPGTFLWCIFVSGIFQRIAV